MKSFKDLKERYLIARKEKETVVIAVLSTLIGQVELEANQWTEV